MKFSFQHENNEFNGTLLIGAKATQEYVTKARITTCFTAALIWHHFCTNLFAYHRIFDIIFPVSRGLSSISAFKPRLNI